MHDDEHDDEHDDHTQTDMTPASPGGQPAPGRRTVYGCHHCAPNALGGFFAGDYAVSWAQFPACPTCGSTASVYRSYDV